MRLFTPQKTPQFDVINWSQAAAVQNTWYTVATLVKASIFLLSFGVSGAAEDIELRIVADGDTETATQNAADPAPTYYIVKIGSIVGTLAIASAANWMGYSGHGSLLDAKSVVISVRKTSAVGVATLHCQGKYAKLI